MNIKPLLLVMAVLCAPAIARSADGSDTHDMHGMHDMKSSAAATSESAAAFEAVNAKMHKSMAIDYTGDADVDFMKGMIPHHQGAIDMAKVLLKYGKDPATRKLAEEIIKAQEGEIAMMQDWLSKHQK